MSVRYSEDFKMEVVKAYRAMRIFLSRYGIYLSKTTVHKYMNKTLNLAAIIMRKKPGYTYV